MGDDNDKQPSGFYQQLNECAQHYHQPYHYLTEVQMRSRISAASPSVLGLNLAHNSLGRIELKVDDVSPLSSPHQARLIEPSCAHVRLFNRSCGESTLGLLQHSPYEFYFAGSQCFICRSSGSLMARWAQTQMSAEFMADIVKLKNQILVSPQHFADHVIEHVFLSRSAPEARELMSFVAQSRQFPVRRSCYVLNILAFLVCALGLSQPHRADDFW